MAEYRTVKVSFWNDPYIEELDAEGKLLYIYLFTCPHANNLGILEVTKRKIAYETALDQKTVERIITRLEADGKLICCDGVLWMTNFIKNQTNTSPKIVACLSKLLRSVGSTRIVEAIYARYPELKAAEQHTVKAEKNTNIHQENGIDTACCDADTVSIPYQCPTDTLRIPPAEREEEREEEEKREGGYCARPHEANSVPGEAGASSKEQPASTGKPKHTDSPSKGHPQWSAFLSTYAVYPVKQGQEDAWREWMRLWENRTLPEPYVIRDAILLLKAEDTRWQRGKVPEMARWLKGKRWEDEPYTEPREPARASPQGQRPLTAAQERRALMAQNSQDVLKAREALRNDSQSPYGHGAGGDVRALPPTEAR